MSKLKALSQQHLSMLPSKYMSTKTSALQSHLSVIVPTFNGASWLPETIDKIYTAVNASRVEKYEILVINDGSTDDTISVVESLAKATKLPIRIVTQPNAGRFVARRTGTNEAKYPNLLFVDTRVFIGEESLRYVLEQQSKDKTRNVWCSHVRVKTTGNIYARFWEAIAYVAWRKYFSNPRDLSYGIKDFDDYPKGTTCFFIKKNILVEANDWFVDNTKDIKTSNDDTLLLRHIAETNTINISPDFWCLYHARSSLKQYNKHVFHRGKVFVDGFLRMDGNKYFWPLIAFLVLSVLVPLVLIINPQFLVPALIVGLIGWLLELLLILLLQVPIRDGLSLFILTPIFSIFYGAGIWRAVIAIYFFRRFATTN